MLAHVLGVLEPFLGLVIGVILVVVVTHCTYDWRHSHRLEWQAPIKVVPR
ncbi:hypothetical protein [Pseudoxanthomonas winnipegensis]|nr:hypothetical protein [Pseudoxanthomonas winnipegensis]